MDVRTIRERVELLRKAGARGADLLFEHAAGQRWAVVRGRVHKVECPERDHLTVRLWVEDGRMGVRSGPAAAWDALVTGAFRDAAAAAPSPHSGPLARPSAVLGGLGILDRRWEWLTDPDREDVLITAEKAVKTVDRRLSPHGFAYDEVLRTRRFVNSRGVAIEEIDSAYAVVGQASATCNGHEVSLVSGVQSRTFASIASIPFGTTLAHRMVELLGPCVDLVGPVRVLLPPLAVARLLGALAERFSVEDFEGPGWFLGPRPCGAPAVDPRLHLQDDGATPGGLRTWSFDDRGAAPVPLTLLREGRVDGRFIDPEAAHRHDVRPTGHVREGRCRPTNLILRSGTRSMSAALADLGGTTLMVDDLPDLSGVDFVTGAMAVRVHGVVMEGNRPVGAVRGRLLHGDLAAALRRVVEICSDTDRIGHVDAPGIVLDGLALE